MRLKINLTSVFYKYLFSFLLITFIPLSFTFIIFYNFSLNLLHNELTHVNLEKFKQCTLSIERSITDYLKRASIIATNPLLSSQKLNGSIYEQYECLSILNSYLTTDYKDSKGYLILKDVPLVYASDGIMSHNTFFNIKTINSVVSKEYLLQFIHNNESYPIITSGNDSSSPYISFLYSLPKNNSYALLGYWIYIEDLYQIFKQSFPDTDFNFSLMSNDLNILATDFDDVSLEKLKTEFEPSKTLQTFHDCKGFGPNDNSILFIYQSSETSILYALDLHPTTSLDQYMFYQHINIYIILFLILIIGILLAFLATFFNYQPIKKLFNSITPLEQKGNELKLIHTFIEDKKNASSSLALYEPYALQRIMQLYLNGLIDVTDYMNALSNFSYNTIDNCYVVIVIDIGSQNSILPSCYRQDLLTFSLELQIKSIAHICCIEQLRESYIIWVINLPTLHDLPNFITIVDNHLYQSSNCGSIFTYNIGIGTITSHIDSIKNSFLEALAVSEYLKQYPTNRILHYKYLSDHLLSSELPNSEYILKLSQALQHGDKIASLELLSAFFSSLTQIYSSFMVLKYFLSEMIRYLKNALGNIVSSNTQQQFHTILMLESTDDIYEASRKLCIMICDDTIPLKKSRQSDMTQSILSYVKKHAFSQSLSLELLADEFHLSSYYISRFITEQTGKNLKSYITDMRLEEAKRLLIETPLSINEIVLQIGYLDCSSFIRKFKKQNGCTPGQYRKNNSHSITPPSKSY